MATPTTQAGTDSPAKILRIGGDSSSSSASQSPTGIGEDPGSLAAASAEGSRAEEKKFPIWKDKFPISEEQIKTVEEIVELLVQTPVTSLYSVQGSLEEKGGTLELVHPLCLVWALVHKPANRAHLNILQAKFVPPASTLWDTLLGYSSLASGKGYARSLENWYKEKSLEEIQEEFDAFYEVLGLKKEILNPLLQTALEAQPKEEKPKEETTSGWLTGAFAKAAAAVQKAAASLQQGAWDPFFKALLEQSSYRKEKAD